MNKEIISILIAGEQAVYYKGLQNLLLRDKKFRVTCIASSGKELLQSIPKQSPAMVIIDTQMQRGLFFCKKISIRYPSIKIIALSDEHDETQIADMIGIGVWAYIHKSAPRKEVLAIVKMVASGKRYYHAGQVAISKQRNAEELPRYIYQQDILLTDREKQLLVLLCADQTTQQVSDAMGINLRTLQRIRAQLKEKLKARTAAGMALYAIKQGLYPLATASNTHRPL